MSLEVGVIISGKVTKITKFGAFIKLSDGHIGLCHISEISNSFVKEVTDVLKVDQEVSVKVLSIGDDGKISLSIKKTEEPVKKQQNSQNSYNGPKKEFKRDSRRGNRDFGKKPQSEVSNKPLEFEDLLTGYMKSSTEKLKNIKKVRSRKGNGYNR